MADTQEFGALLQTMRRMQHGTKALVRCAGRELAICECTLSEDLDTCRFVPCEPVAKDGSVLVININTDVEAVQPHSGDASVLLRMVSGELELVFATDADCNAWHLGFSFLKGNIAADCAPSPQAAQAAAAQRQAARRQAAQATVAQRREAAQAAQATAAQAAAAQAAEEQASSRESWEDVESLEARNRELVDLVRHKDATIAQLLREANAADGGVEEDPGARTKDRLIAQLRAENEALRAQLGKKDRAVRNLVQALEELQAPQAEDEEPFLPPTRTSPSRAQADEPFARAEAPDEADLEQLQSAIGTLTSKFDGLEHELEEKAQRLQELYAEEKAAKAEHAALTGQLQQLESQERALFAPPEEDTPEGLAGMQQKVQQLEAMLASLPGAQRSPPRSPPRAQQQLDSQDMNRTAQAMQAMQELISGMQSGPPTGDIAGNLADLEAKKRKIEELAQALNIDLTE